MQEGAEVERGACKAAAAQAASPGHCCTLAEVNRTPKLALELQASHLGMRAPGCLRHPGAAAWPSGRSQGPARQRCLHKDMGLRYSTYIMRSRTKAFRQAACSMLQRRQSVLQPPLLPGRLQAASRRLTSRLFAPRMSSPRRKHVKASCCTCRLPETSVSPRDDAGYAAAVAAPAAAHLVTPCVLLPPSRSEQRPSRLMQEDARAQPLGGPTFMPDMLRLTSGSAKDLLHGALSATPVPEAPCF